MLSHCLKVHKHVANPGKIQTRQSIMQQSLSLGRICGHRTAATSTRSTSPWGVIQQRVSHSRECTTM